MIRFDEELRVVLSIGGLHSFVRLRMEAFIFPIIEVTGCAKQADTNELVKSNLTKG